MNTKDATLAVLQRARARIAHGWTQGTYAKDASGEPVSSCSPRAACYCALGALKVENVKYDPSLLLGEPELAETIGTRTIIIWNDTPGRTQSEVLAAFDQTILRLQNAQI